MASITLKGSTVHTSGSLPAVGSTAPDFRLTRSDLSDVKLADFGNSIKIFNIVPSLDTGTCASSARRFEKESGELKNVIILTISNDLPFAMGRFCTAEGITHVIPLSSLRDRSFGKAYGLEIIDGKLEGLLSRVVLVLDRNNKIVYSEQVPEISQEPDYAKALDAVKKLV